MKINPTTVAEPQLTVIGKPFDEGYAEQLDPKTGRDPGDISPGSIELMPYTVTSTDDVSHTGDMGRLGKSE